jgi:hypothetical protein
LPAGLLLVVAGCMVSLSKSDPVLLRPEGTLEADFQGSVKKNVIRDSKVMFLLCIQILDVCVNRNFAEVLERQRCRV